MGLTFCGFLILSPGPLLVLWLCQHLCVSFGGKLGRPQILPLCHTGECATELLLPSFALSHHLSQGLHKTSSQKVKHKPPSAFNFSNLWFLWGFMPFVSSFLFIYTSQVSGFRSHHVTKTTFHKVMSNLTAPNFFFSIFSIFSLHLSALFDTLIPLFSKLCALLVPLRTFGLFPILFCLLLLVLMRILSLNCFTSYYG